MAKLLVILGKRIRDLGGQIPVRQTAQPLAQRVNNAVLGRLHLSPTNLRCLYLPPRLRNIRRYQNDVQQIALVTNDRVDAPLEHDPFPFCTGQIISAKDAFPPVNGPKDIVHFALLHLLIFEQALKCQAIQFRSRTQDFPEEVIAFGRNPIGCELDLHLIAVDRREQRVVHEIFGDIHPFHHITDRIAVGAMHPVDIQIQAKICH
ncbi:hypothetical protein XMM379_003121 [Aliiroseovarius sp. xm-m-379]|nr:hypothetical protein [Aliiroseovarius sp. xm-m-379]NRP32119.1 hypothetical protein [Aliiroseovarius sp. xm-m-314]NRP42836.1 hypothetical protein [Aliiroseovarius sp. xm-m-339-2]NRP45984.1 hypothetical protein [Aliiroseovarius sp. xm-m-378]NRP51459.1 hypothetical protein [Aliiroseovarius sp. xm-m-354]NRP63711.1 hypothetical protein [Aliiroseovarius sp. xm-a-151]NRP66852.1 hypothetical protein [Aliiroseovarius sp. xm-v-225]NRP81761.1 hypothetical protein [Aliiroseovarius sp. xm-v-209]NRP93